MVFLFEFDLEFYIWCRWMLIVFGYLKFMLFNKELYEISVNV